MNDPTMAAERHPIQNLVDQAREFGTYLGLNAEGLAHLEDLVRSAYATGVTVREAKSG